MWARYSDAELIERSELIVQGRFIGTTEIKPRGAAEAARLGVIEVIRVVKGDPRVRAALLALPPRGRPVASTDLYYREGQEGLWFLYQRPGAGIGGVCYADHPQRFLPADRKDEATERLRKRLIR